MTSVVQKSVMLLALIVATLVTPAQAYYDGDVDWYVSGWGWFLWSILFIGVIVILIVVGLSCAGVAICCFCCRKDKEGKIYKTQEDAQRGAMDQVPCPSPAPVYRQNGGVVPAGTYVIQAQPVIPATDVSTCVEGQEVHFHTQPQANVISTV